MDKKFRKVERSFSNVADISLLLIYCCARLNKGVSAFAIHIIWVLRLTIVHTVLVECIIITMTCELIMSLIFQAATLADLIVESQLLMRSFAKTHLIKQGMKPEDAEVLSLFVCIYMYIIM